MRQPIDVTGQTFGALKVIQMTEGRNKHWRLETRAMCQCLCGEVLFVKSHQLRSKSRTSCGCRSHLKRVEKPSK